MPKKQQVVTARLELPVWGPIASPDPLWGPNLIEAFNGESTRNLQKAGIEFTEPEGLSDLVIQRGHAAGSNVWYAARVVEQVALARSAFMSNPSGGETVHALLHLGMLFMEASTVIMHGPEFKTGVKQYQLLAKTRSNWNARQQARASYRHSIWISKAKEIWGINPKLTVSRCAELVITKLTDGVARKTVEDVIRAYSPRRKVKVSDAG